MSRVGDSVPEKLLHELFLHAVSRLQRHPVKSGERVWIGNREHLVVAQVGSSHFYDLLSPEGLFVHGFWKGTMHLSG